jgi:hypothetical protein
MRTHSQRRIMIRKLHPLREYQIGILFILLINELLCLHQESMNNVEYDRF